MGAIIPWLLKVDPNTIIAILSIGAGWVWSKLSKEKRQTIERIIGGAVDAILSEISAHVPTALPDKYIASYLSTVRDYVEKRIWIALAKRNVPRNALTERLVHAAIEESTARLGARIAADRKAKEPPA